MFCFVLMIITISVCVRITVRQLIKEADIRRNLTLEAQHIAVWIPRPRHWRDSDRMKLQYAGHISFKPYWDLGSVLNANWGLECSPSADLLCSYNESYSSAHIPQLESSYRSVWRTAAPKNVAQITNNDISSWNIRVSETLQFEDNLI
jgi:hypothetical protein